LRYVDNKDPIGMKSNNINSIEMNNELKQIRSIVLNIVNVVYSFSVNIMYYKKKINNESVCRSI